MQPQRITGLIALVILFLVVAVLIYIDFRPRPEAPEPPAITADAPSAATATPPAAPPADSPPEAKAEPPASPPSEVAVAEPPVSPTPPAPSGGADSGTPSRAPADGTTPAAEGTDSDTAKAESQVPSTPPLAEATPTPPEAAEDKTGVAGAPTPTESETAPSEPSAAAKVAKEAPPASATPEAAESAESPTAPSFDVVRVEPTGDTVIAGLAQPDSTVEVLDGGQPVATARANERGEWAMTLDKRLEPGTHDLAIRTTSPDQASVTLSDQRVAVQVPSDASKDVLVVLNTPDQPSQVLQLPKAAEAPAEKPPEVAAGPAGEKAKPDDEAAVAAAPPAEPEPEAVKPGEKETEMAAVPEKPAETSPANPPASETAPAASAEAPVPENSVTAGIEAGRAGEKTIAEAGPTPGTGEPVAEATAGGGEAPKDQAEVAKPSEPAPAPPTPEERATASAEPETKAPAAGETSEEAAPATSADRGEAPARGEEQPPAMAERPADEPAPAPPPKIEPSVGVAAVEADTSGALFIAGTAATGERIRVYLDGDLLGEATPTEGGTWLLEARRDLPAGTYRVRAEQVESGGAVVASADVPFEREVEVATLEPSASTGAASGAAMSGSMPEPQTVIIKRGDNLWRISRKMYGKGVRWSTIYDSNRDQIKRPRLIYPGQVFVIPAGDMRWKE